MPLQNKETLPKAKQTRELSSFDKKNQQQHYQQASSCHLRQPGSHINQSITIRESVVQLLTRPGQERQVLLQIHYVYQARNQVMTKQL